ncbi:MAG: glycosyltransferase, partial [Pseudomonadota bacterium]
MTAKRVSMLIIVIPTWQAQKGLERLLPQLAGERVIVADGGSTDGSLKTAVRAGCVMALGASGRGSQLRLGAQAAILSGQQDDWFLFLHADSQLPPDWRAIVGQAMTRSDARYFQFRADAPGFKARLMDRLVALRCRLLGLPYGDQGLLISRPLYERAGGYADMPLFEDVDLVERVREVGRLRPLPAVLQTDVSKHWANGLWRRGTRNLGLLWRYKRGVSTETLLRDYLS